MKTDLFTTKEEALKDWMRDRTIFASHEAIEWGIHNYYNRAQQTKTDFHRQGLIQELSPQDKAFYGYKCKDSVYRWIGVRNGEEKI